MRGIVGWLLTLMIILPLTAWGFGGNSGSSGGGGGASTTQGIGGGATNTPGADSIVNAKNYGAIADGSIAFDAAMGVGAPTAGSSSTAALSAPAYTTDLNNTLVFSAFSRVPNASTLSSGPSGTNIANIAPSAGQNLGLWFGYQLQASPGTVVANTATQSANGWAAMTVALSPPSGSITVGNSSNCTAAGTSTAACAKPVGTAAGDTLLALVAWYPQNASPATTMATPAGWLPCGNLVTGFGSSNGAISCFVKPATGTEGTTSFVGSSAGAVPAAAIIDLQATNIVFDNKITSASANFVAGAVGKPMCVAAVTVDGTSTTHQACGTIGVVGSTTTAYATTIINSTTASVSAKWYQYGTASTCTQLGFNALGAGVTHIHVPAGIYQLTTPCTVPAGTSLIFEGDGRTLANWGYVTGGTTVNNAKQGTYISWLTTTMTNPAISVNPASTNGVNANVFSIKFKDLTLWGGVGTGQDGGGSDGMLFTSVDWLTLDNVAIGNFAGEGINLESGGGSGYVDGVYFVNVWSLANGLDGWLIGGSTLLQNIWVGDSQFDNNLHNGINITATGPIWSFVITGASNIQRNNTANVGSSTYQQIKVTSSQTISGCLISGNYFEDDGSQTPPGANSSSWTGCTWASNTALVGASFQPTFSGSGGVGLLACANTYAGTSQTVTDALSCKPGATYAAAGGTATCQATCNGTNWLFTPGGGSSGSPWPVNLSGSANAVVSNSVANVFPISGVGTPIATTSEGTVSIYSPVVATARNLKCTLTNAAGTATVAGGTNYVLALRQNLASSASTCTIAAAASTCTDTTHAIAIAIGDQLDVIDTPTGTPTALIPHCSVELDY